MTFSHEAGQLDPTQIPAFDYEGTDEFYKQLDVLGWANVDLEPVPEKSE